MSSQPNLEALDCDHTAPARWAVAVIPSDTVSFNKYPTRALWVGTGGNMSIVMADGNTAVFANVPGGTLLPVAAMRVNATGTTTSNVLAVY